MACGVLVLVALLDWKFHVVDSGRVVSRATDLFKEHLPTFQAGFAAWREGRLALWNPDQLAGLPFMAVPYAGLLYPGNIAYLLFADTALAIELTELAHVVFGGLCMAVLVRVLSMSWLAAVSAGFTLMLSGWFGSQIHFPVLVQGMAWLPATILMVEGTLRRNRLAPFGLAFAVALQVLNGATEFLILNLYAAGLYAAFGVVFMSTHAPLRGRVMRLLVLFGAVCAGALLAGVQLLPSLELVAMSDRAQGVSLAAALFDGTVPAADFLLLSMMTAGVASVGTLPMLGVVLGAGVHPLRRIWLYTLLLAGLAVVLTSGGALYELYFETPIGQLFRRPNKLLHLYAFAAALLAALAVTRLSDVSTEVASASSARCDPSLRRALFLVVSALLGAMAWLALGDFFNPYLAVTAAMLCAFAFVPPRARVIVVVALVATHAADLVVSTRNTAARPYTHPLLLHRNSELFERLAETLGEGRLHLSAELELQHGLTFKQGTLRGLPVLMDKQPLTMGRHDAYLRTLGRHVTREGHVWLTPTSNLTLLDLASVRYLILKPDEYFDTVLREKARSPVESGIKLLRVSRTHRVYERTNWLPRARVVGRALWFDDPEEALAQLDAPGFDPRRHVVLEGTSDAPATLDAREVQGRARIVVDTPERVEIEAKLDAPGFLVLGDSHYPGWRATVDGVEVEILRANALFRAVALQAGASQVVFEYAPRSLYLGLASSGLTLFVLLGLMWHGRSTRVPGEAG